MTALVLKAADFAARKHRSQRRKEVEASPYINHPIQVARILSDVGGVTDEDILAAALLHDTIEDTDTTADELDAEFGARIRGIVEEVTDDKTLKKVERKRLQIEHASELSHDATLVKLGDKIANVQDITSNPPAGWDMERRLEYLDWAKNVVEHCPEASEALLVHFQEVVDDAYAQLSKG